MYKGGLVEMLFGISVYLGMLAQFTLIILTYVYLWVNMYTHVYI